MRKSSLAIFALICVLFLLNVIDIATTIPEFEGNPITRYAWTKIGYAQSAILKLGLVVVLGVISLGARIASNEKDWKFASKIIALVLLVLIIYYLGVIAINIQVLRIVSEFSNV